mgnify:CR=1 FL=1
MSVEYDIFLNAGCNACVYHNTRFSLKLIMASPIIIDIIKMSIFRNFSRTYMSCDNIHIKFSCLCRVFLCKIIIENKNVYSFLLQKPNQIIDFKMRLPRRFLHVCSGCGKREVLTSREAFDQGWDYPGPDGIYKDMPNYGFGVLVPRTCGQCTINKSLYWKLTVDKDAPNCMSQEEIAEALERIQNEPMSLIVDGDEINEPQL